jgi:dihydroorotate dehydrogenase electron transfer subunit
VRSDHSAVLLRKHHFSSGLFSATFECEALARAIRPGQFVMLEVPDRIRPYLRRAYSVADAHVEAGEVELLVKTIGPGTAALEALPAGESVWMLGPLGNGFSLDGFAREGARVAIVAGGIGAAPFPLLLRALSEAGIVADLFFGGRSGPDVSLAARFGGIVSGDLRLATDDGSVGERGFVTELFAREAASLSSPYVRVYACGPMPMFASLARVVERLGLPAEFSTEAEMGCGFGACLACVIPGTEKTFLVSCTDGPILAPERIRW